MAPKVKICGITRLEDAQAAVAAGADALGFVFSDQSPRQLSLQAAAAIAKQVPMPVLRAGVFVNAPVSFVWEAITACGLTLLQFHGDEPPEYCTQFPVMSMKAFRVRDRSSLEQLRSYPTDAWLLDSYSKQARGGTGEKFDWTLAKEATGLGRPIFLAGGLTPENVGDAVRAVQPFGVDVSSGVEATPGIKDHAKVRAFINAAKTALG